MPDTLIENRILNSPYSEPARHFRFGDEGITNEIVGSRRASAYFVPIPLPKKKGKQLQFETQWTQDLIQSNDQVEPPLRTGHKPESRVPPFPTPSTASSDVPEPRARTAKRKENGTRPELVGPCIRHSGALRDSRRFRPDKN